MTTPTIAGPVLPEQVRPPEFELSALLPGNVPGAEVVALPVLPGDDAVMLGPGAAELSDELGIDLLEVAALHRLTGATGDLASIPVPDGTTSNPVLRLVLLVGVGAGDRTGLRRAGAVLARATRDRQVVATTIAAAPVADDVDASAAVEAVVAGAALGSFVFHWRSGGAEEQPVGRVVLAGCALPDGQEALARSVALASASWNSRFWATVPSNLKNPAWLAGEAARVADESGLSLTVWDEKQLARDGFGGILGVGQASASPPRLIRLDYTPDGLSARAAKKLPHVVLVGKGITFDTGGLSIKPGPSMSSMKRDMTGGAVVLATMGALAEVGCPLRVTGLVAAAENAVSGTAMRPGDVLRHWGGRTTEVGNTDAEGRLVLGDALAYAVGELAPDAIVDIATLTGAVKVALGQQVGGLFANDDALAASLDAAGEMSGEPVWRFPLFAGYEEKLASKVADAANDPGGPGAITAALFLQHFVGDVPWAHLDIASVGDVEKDWYEWTVGPSGFGARLLLSWLGSDEPLAGVASD